jgi:hypothetical protein
MGAERAAGASKMDVQPIGVFGGGAPAIDHPPSHEASAGACWARGLSLPLAWAGIAAVELACAAAVEAPGDLWTGVQALWGASFAIGLAALVTWPVELALCRKAGRLVLGVALAAVAFALNVEAYVRGFQLVALGPAAAMLLAPILAGSGRGWVRKAFLILAPAAALAAVWGDVTQYPGRYPNQHATLSLFALWSAACWITTMTGGRGTRQDQASLDHRAALRLSLRTALIAVALGAGVAAFWLFGRGRVALEAAEWLWTRPPTIAAVLRLAAPLADGDGDGFSNLLIRTDCDDHDPSVNPQARETAGNGLDDNCLSGDAAPGRNHALQSVRPARAASVIVLITLDAVRADRIYRDGAFRVAPSIVSLSSRCAVFSSAWSTYGSTQGSVFSMLSSRYVTQATGVVPCGEHRVPSTSTPTLQRLLARSGWRTRAVVSPWMLKPECGLTEGFGDVHVDPIDAMDPTPRAEVVTDQAIESLAGTEPLFLWVHYYDPHWPYFIAEGTEEADDDLTAQDRDLQRTDIAAARLLDAIGQRALVVISSDHGELFKGRTLVGHYGLEAEALQVPLIVCGPGIGPRVLEEPVSLLDLAPTLLDLAGLPSPSEFRGVSLRRAIETGSTAGLRGWAAAEYLGGPGADDLSRLLVGRGFSVHSDHRLSVYEVIIGGRTTRASDLRGGTEPEDAFLDLVERQLALPEPR